MSNLACRIFKEQLDLLLSLPNQEEAKTVLYQAVINSFNQFEYQNENQIENQNENAYVSVSLSELSKSILNLLSKNIVWKEFSNNYGGKREKAGRPKKQENQEVNNIQKIQKNQKIHKLQTETLNINKNISIIPSKEEVINYALSRNRLDLADKFYDYYTAGNWQGIKNWKQKFITWESHNEKPKENKIFIDNELRAKL